VITLPFFTTLTSDEMDYMVNALKEVEREIQ
jgi:dTDP-4-amino-4,6-dideoxygalactose transaminase